MDAVALIERYSETTWISPKILSNSAEVSPILALYEIFGRGVSVAELSISLILYFLFFPIVTSNRFSSEILTSILSFLSALFISLENSSILTPNLTSLSHSYFSNAELGHAISISATCDGSIPLNAIPSPVASKVASSTNVEIAEITAFHSSDPLVFAENTKLNQMSSIFKLNVMRSYATYSYI